MLKNSVKLAAFFLLSLSAFALEPCPNGDARQSVAVCSEQYNLALDALDTVEVMVIGDWPAVSCSVLDERLQVTYIVGTATVTPPTTPALYAESCKVENGVALVSYRIPGQKVAWYSKFWNTSTAFISGVVVGSLVTVGIMK